ncbi:AAA family ATPase [Lysinibacillus boronitolerans]|uniref:AAA family ATPase n=1 Tax=Lysinibacillus boronitolerans TaxID=309788 RepID=UPI000319BEB1|nr:MoxR family ATPase [Lysinibacillus boronitolerans]
MNTIYNVTQKQLYDFLLNVATIRPVFIWGAPGIGKSAIVENFASELGLPCVSLLGSQLAPEDIIGVPQIKDGYSVFCPPKIIARDEPYCLFLDELNACSQEVQKAFYSLIHERRIGEFTLPEGTIVIGAGNRAQDNAIVKPMSSALINRMVHVQLRASHKDWLEWAYAHEIHPYVIEYIQMRPDHLWSEPPKTEEPFSTPRSWHMLSDCLYAYGSSLQEQTIDLLASSCLSAHTASQFKAFIKQVQSKYDLAKIIQGELRWPDQPDERDLLYFLAQSFRSQLLKELPNEHTILKGNQRQLAFRAKDLIKDLSSISLEIAQMVVSEQKDEALPAWFMLEVIRDLPRLVAKKEG